MNALSRPAALTASSIVAAFFFVVPHLAAAEALDFDDLSSDGGTGGLPAVNSPCFGENGSCLAFLDERGYRFTSAADGVNDHAHLVSAPYFFGTQSWASNGTNYIGLDATNITFERIDGQLFSLHRIDAAEGVLNSGLAIGFAGQLVITGQLSGGGSVNATFDFDGVNDGTGPAVDFQTFELPANFTSLVSVTLLGAGNAPSLFSVDNLTVTTVPLPLSMALFGPTLLSLVARRRRGTDM